MGHRSVLTLGLVLSLAVSSTAGAVSRPCKWMVSLLIGTAGVGSYFLRPSEPDFAQNYRVPAAVERERYSELIEDLFDADGKAKISLHSDSSADEIPTLLWFAGNDLVAERIKSSVTGLVPGIDADPLWSGSGVPLRFKNLLLKAEGDDRVRIGVETNFQTLYSENTERFGVLFSGKPCLIQIFHTRHHEGRTIKIKGHALVVYREAEQRFDFLQLEATLTVPIGIEVSSKGTVPPFSSAPMR